MEENNNIEQIEEDYEYITYLIGAMTITAEKDGGIAKREDLDKELKLRKVLGINPAILEKCKTGMEVNDAIDKIKGWVSGGKRDLLQETGKQIWKGTDGIGDRGNLLHICGDLDYVKMSNWITFVLHAKDRPCGSYFECGVAIENNIPIYLITDIPKKDLPQSLILGIESVEGEFFENQNQYFEFIDKKYGLKRKEIKNEK